jgi:hypothetical protein
VDGDYKYVRTTRLCLFFVVRVWKTECTYVLNTLKKYHWKDQDEDGIMISMRIVGKLVVRVGMDTS